MNPFDLPIDTFLIAYGAYLVASFALATFIRWFTRLPVAGPPSEDPQLSLYEVAYLGGGEERVLQAALARLVRAHVFEYDHSRHVITLTSTALPPDASDIEREFCAEVRNVQNREAAQMVAQRLSRALQPARTRLEGLGLLAREREMRIARWGPIALMAIALALGGARFLIEILTAVVSLFSRVADMRDTFRETHLLIQVVQFSMAIGLMYFSRRILRSRRGDAVLSRLRAKHAHLELRAGHRLSELSDDELVLAIGIFGHAVLLGGPLAALEPIFATADFARNGGGWGHPAGFAP